MGYDEFTRPDGAAATTTQNGTDPGAGATSGTAPQPAPLAPPQPAPGHPQVAPALPPDSRAQVGSIDPRTVQPYSNEQQGSAHYHGTYPPQSQPDLRNSGVNGYTQSPNHPAAGGSRPGAHTSSTNHALAQPNQSPPPQHYPAAAAASQLATDQIAALRPVTQAKLASTAGMRGSLNKVGLSLGVSKKEQRQLDLINEIRTPLAGSYWIPVLSIKGGCGKTTTVAGLAATMAFHRPDRIIAIDTNPDYGLLDRRTVGAPRGPAASFRDLVFHADKVTTYGDMRSCTAVTSANLEVLRGGFALTEAGFSASDFPVVDAVLRKFYNVIFADCGTALREPLLRSVLNVAQGAVIVTNTTREGVEGAASTIDWLRANGYEELLAKSVIGVTINTPGKPYLDVGAIVDGFSRQQRPVHVIPWDPHIAEGGPIDLRMLKKKTRAAYERLAGSVAKEFASAAVGWR